MFIALSGCSLWDATARKDSARHMVTSMTPTWQYVHSELSGRPWQSNKWCEQVQINEPPSPESTSTTGALDKPANMSLTVRFACNLSPSVITAYREGLSTIHPQLLERLRSSALASSLPLQWPLCITIVGQDSAVRRTQALDKCFPFYLQSVYANSDTPNLSHAPMLTSIGLYTTWAHEALHASTFGRSGPYQDPWVNEYIAAVVASYVSTTLLTIFNQRPLLPFSLDEKTQAVVNTIKQQGCENLQQTKYDLIPDIDERSLAGTMLQFGRQFALSSSQSMEALYLEHEMHFFADPHADVELLFSHSPLCHPNQIGDLYAFQLGLLDYNLQQLAPDAAGFGAMVANRFQLSATPFATCHDPHMSEASQMACVAFELDQRTLKATPLPKQLHLPHAAQGLTQRLAQLQQDLAWPQNPLTTDRVYHRDADGFMRNSRGWLADTASVLSQTDAEDCSLLGEQLTQTLVAMPKKLKRCQSHPNYGVLWRDTTKPQKLLGGPQLYQQRAMLRATPASLEQGESVPFVYAGGFFVFQQDDQQVPINLCLDTGSKFSYLTERYLKRYQVPPQELLRRRAKHPDPSNGWLIRWPLLGEERWLKRLPGPGPSQCDVIVGSDLLGLYSAISLEEKQLVLWQKITPHAPAQPKEQGAKQQAEPSASASAH